MLSRQIGGLLGSREFPDVHITADSYIGHSGRWTRQHGVDRAAAARGGAGNRDANHCHPPIAGAVGEGAHWRRGTTANGSAGHRGAREEMGER